MSQRIHPKVVFSRDVRNQSGRGGQKPKLIVVHATESSNRPGSSDLAAIGTWFDNPAAQASSHVCTDADGNSARYVRDENKAWHCAGFNSVSLGIEQVGRAAQTAWTRDELRETARWIAKWSLKYGIPIRKGAVKGASVTRSGVIRHSELGQVGGGHHDPGPGYPMHSVLALARFYAGKLKHTL